MSILQQPGFIAPVNYSGLNVGSSMWNIPVPIFWGMRRLSTNAIWFNDFYSQPAGGKGKGAGAKSNIQMTYTAAVILGLCEGPIDDIQNSWANGSTTSTATLSYLNLTLFTGTISQAPWSYVATSYPSQARAYSQLAYLASPKLHLGESATVPDNAFEVARANGFAYTNPGNGWINPNTHAVSPGLDCLMSDIITDLLTNVQYGMGFTSADLGAISQFATYGRAQGLFYSPLLNTQEKANQLIDRWALTSNAWIYWTGTQLQFVPLADEVVTGNGVTYTPADDVAYSLTTADFLAATGQDAGPVKVSRIDPADAYNRTVLDITDRTLGYIDNPFEWKDDGLVDQYGLRDNANTQADEICDPAVARVVVQLIGRRAAYIRNTYAFKTSNRFILCLPGTILTLTEPNLGLSNLRVRVKTIQEDDKGQLAFECEEYPGGVGVYYAPGAAAAAFPATTPVTNIFPGNVNTPAIVEPNSAFTGGAARLIVAASGGANWGGCTVNISFDGTNYSQVGTITAPARQGALTAALAAYGGANPDLTDTLGIDCTQSLTLPAPVTDADATALRTLSLIAAQPIAYGGAYILPSNGELLAFGALTATGTYAANLTYLERGAYGTTPGAHSIGDQFTQVDVSGTDGTAVAFTLPKQYIGQTIYLKLCSFNPFRQALQDPSTVLEYQYTPTGGGYGAATAGVPLETTGFGVVGSPTSAAVVLGWTANAATDNVIAYELYRAAGTGAAFSAAALVWTGQALAHTDTGVSAATGYTYFLVPFNIVGAGPQTAGVNATTALYGPTAAAIANQGTLATQNSVNLSTQVFNQLGVANAVAALVNANIPAGGVNRVQFSLFEKGATYWTTQESGVTSPTFGIYTSGGLTFGQFQGSAPVVGNSISLLSDAFYVAAGESVAVSAQVNVPGAHTGTIGVQWFNASNALISTSIAVSGITGGAVEQVSGVVVAPAGALTGEFVATVTATSVGTVQMFVAQPMVCGIATSQAAIPTFNAGPNSVAGADVTAANIAAGISGQGSFATLSSAAYGSTYLTGFGGLAARGHIALGDGYVFRADGVTSLTDVLAVTSLGTAAAIAGQGPGATAAGTAVLNVNVQAGQNVLVDSEFQQGTVFWSVGNLSGGTNALTIGLNYSDVNGTYANATQNVIYARNTGVTMASGSYFQMRPSNSMVGGTLGGIAPGQVIGASAQVVTYRSTMTMGVDWLAADGSYAGGGGQFATQGELDTGAVAWAAPVTVSGVLTVPTDGTLTKNVRGANLWFAIDGNGGTDPFLFVSHPILAVLPAGQLVVPVYTPGRTNPLADQTSAHTAAAIAGQGSFATLSSVGYGSSYLTGFGALAATNYADMTLADGASGGIHGKNTSYLVDGANLGGTAAWGGVSSRPTELTDGRVAAGLAPATGYITAGLNAAIPTTAMLAGISGTNLALNPEFTTGTTADWSAYAPGGTNPTTISIVSDTSAPNGSNNVLQIAYAGGSASLNGTGAYQGLNYAGSGQSSRPGYYSQSTQILYKIIAKIPVGYTLNVTSNSFGTGGTSTPLTSMAGTGAWANYSFIYQIGAGGTLQNIGFLYVNSGPNVAFNWYIARFDQIDITSAQRNFMGNNFADELGVPRFKTDLVTSVGIAAAIASQGSLATLSSVSLTSQVTGALPVANAAAGLVNANIPAGNANRVRFSQFEKGTEGWSISAYAGAYGGALTTGASGAYEDLIYNSTFTGTGQYQSVVSQSFPVTAGETLAIQARLSTNDYCTAVMTLSFSTGAGPQVLPTAGVGTPPDYLFQGNYVVPASATSAFMALYIYSTGASAARATLSQPMVTGAATGQTAYPAFTPGPASEAGADVTANYTAAGVAGQGSLATLSSIGPAQISIGTVSSANLILNPGAEASSTGTPGWQGANLAVAGAGAVFSVFTTPTPNSGAHCFHLAKAVATDGGGACSVAIPVVAGKTYNVSLSVTSDGATTSGLYFRMAEFGTAAPSGGFVTQTGSGSSQASQTDLMANAAIPASWTKYTFAYTVPAGVYWVSPTIYNYINGPLNMWFDDVVFQPAIDSGTQLPLNLTSGLGYTFNPSPPLSATSGQIAIAATTVSYTGQTLSAPSGTITGLTNGSYYSVFYDTVGLVYIAVHSGATSYATNPSRYISFGTVQVPSSGTYTGGGGSGGILP